MSRQVASHRQILKSSSIIGAASIINILIGLVRTKMLALLLGPAGVGLVSLYTTLLQTAATVATMGMGTVGTRQIAEASGNDDQQSLAIARRAMFWGAMLLASAGASAVWCMREMLALYVLGSTAHAHQVGWLALGVALTVAGSSQGALLQGMRRISDMAKLSVLGAVVNTTLGLAILGIWGEAGLLAFVLVGPLVNFFLGHLFVRRLPKPMLCDISMHEMTQQWKTLLKLGIPFMAAGLVSSLVQLWIRIEVGGSLGSEALGHFQAAWLISMQYIGFILSAMTADFYPRLTQLINDKEAATRLVNEQTEFALLVSAPIFIAMIGLSPWIVQLLYSAEFSPAVDVLRWQILGDVLKVASWPLGFVILAAGAGKTFFGTEAFALLLMGGLIAGLTSSVGLQITGIAFLVCYAAYLPLVYWLAKRRIDFKWQPNVLRLLLAIFATCMLVAVLSTSYWWGSALAICLSLVFGGNAVLRIAYMSNMDGKLGRITAAAKKAQRLFSARRRKDD